MLVLTMNLEDKNFATKCMAEFIRIRMDNDRDTFPVDVDHSALLNYLLDGNRPFKNPPPKSYSYPDYKMAEGKEVLVELWEDKSLFEDRIVINQCKEWEWEDKEKRVLKHLPTGDLYQFKKLSAEELVRNYYTLSPKYPIEEAIQNERELEKTSAEKGIFRGVIQRIGGVAERLER